MRRVLTPLLTVVGLLVVWELVVDLGIIPNFLLPTPVQVVQALVSDFSLIVGHAATTLVETAIGLLISALPSRCSWTASRASTWPSSRS